MILIINKILEVNFAIANNLWFWTNFRGKTAYYFFFKSDWNISYVFRLVLKLYATHVNCLQLSEQPGLKFCTV